jgi:hypothetical protein
MHIVEAMDWADDNDTDYIFGLAGRRRTRRPRAGGRRQSAVCHATSSETNLRTL